MSTTQPSTREPRHESSCNKPLLSRRQVVGAAALGAAVLVLPDCITGNSLLTPWKAYAADSVPTGASTSEGSAKIVVVSAKHVGFAAVDVNSKDTYIDGVTITVTSRYDKTKSVSGVTGDTGVKGVALLNIETLAEGYDGKTSLSSYAFNATIEAKKDGLRLYKVGLDRVIGGTGYSVPVCSADDDRPYAQLATFDEWDAQYVAQELATTKKNDSTHTFALDLVLPEGAQGSISLQIKGEKSPRSSQKFTAGAKGSLTHAEFSGAYLLLGGKEAIAPGSTVQFICAIDSAQGKTSYSLPASFTLPCSLAVTSAQADELIDTSDVFSLPLNEANTVENLSITMPAKWPFLGGTTLDIWTPSFPVLFNFSPFGAGMVGFSFAKFGYVADEGTIKTQEWKKQPKKSAKEQWTYIRDRQKDSIAKYKSCMNSTDPDVSGFNHIKFASTVDVTVAFQIMLQADCAYLDEKPLDLDLLGVVLFNGLFSASEQFTVGPVPMFLQGDITVSAKAALGIGGTFPYIASIDGGSFFRGLAGATWDYKNTGLTFLISAGIALTLGIGFAGFVSVGIRGSASISVYIGFIPREKKGDAIPHVLVNASAWISVCVQLMVLKWNKQLYGKDWELYNNRKRTSSSFSNKDGDYDFKEITGVSDLELLVDGKRGYVATGPGLTGGTLTQEDVDSFLATAQLVTNDELAAISEATVVASSQLFAPGKKLADTIVSQNNSSTILKLEAGTLTGTVTANALRSSNAVCRPAQTVAGVSKEGGVIPDVDVVFCSGVFSDPRQKVVALDGETWLFRLASIAYQLNGNATTEARTRVVRQKYDDATGTWGSPVILDFDPRLDDVIREDMYDYDFDVIACNKDDVAYLEKSCFRVVVCSSLREQGDDTLPVSVCTTPLMTYLICYPTDSYEACESTTWRSLLGQKYQKGYHFYCAPRITYLPEYKLTSIAHLHRQADKAEDVLTEAATVNFEYAATNVVGDLALLNMPAMELDPTSFDLEISSCPQLKLAQGTPVGTALVWVLAQNKCEAYAMLINSNYEPIGQEDEAQTANNLALGSDSLWDTHMMGKGEFGAVAHLNAWNGQPGVLFSNNKHLYSVIADANSDQSSVVFQQTEVGPADFNMDSFALSPDGKMLFSTLTKDGKDGMRETDQGALEDTEASVHTIMASNLVDGRYAKPYPYAQLDHPVDYLLVAGSNQGTANATVFVAGVITDLTTSKLDLRYISIPSVACATPADLVCKEPLTYPGQLAPFTLTVRNNGNLMLEGCTCTFCDESGSAIDDPQNLTFNLENVRASVFNEHAPRNAAEAVQAMQEVQATDQGSWLLDNPDAAGVLIPGASNMYELSLRVPDDWAGTKTVCVKLSDFRVHENDEALDSLDSQELAFHLLQGADERPKHTISVGGTASIDAEYLVPAPVKPTEEAVVEEEPEPKKDNTGAVVAGVVGAAAVVAAGAGGYAYWKKHQTAESAAAGDAAGESAPAEGAIAEETPAEGTLDESADEANS